MSESLFSASWYRVAELRPRLRSHTEFHRHHYRGQLWYVLQNHSTGRNHRFSPAAHHLVGLMDGTRSVDEIWNAALEEFGDDAPTQDEAIRLLAQLHSSDDLQCDVTPDTVELFERYERQQRGEWKKRLANPLSLRFPLLDPDRFLVRALPWVAPVFGRLGALVWLAVVGSALVLASSHWSELTGDVMAQVTTPENLLLLWITYPIVKGLHELGHAFATRVWGGEVHEMGIVLLVLMPIPYVDASAAAAFREKRRRVVVGAAGMLVETFLAALAMLVWLLVEPGMVRTLAFDVMLIGGVSTLAFNGNPLLRFDGYYILADAVDIPNLSARSTRYLGFLVKKHLFGVQELSSPAFADGEGRWFVAYGLASLVYRFVILFAIVFFVASRLFVVGVLLGIFAVATQVFLPAGKHLRTLFFDPALRRQRPRALAVSAGLAASLLLLLFVVPIPLSTRAEGVVWVPEQSQVRVGADGFVVRLLAEPESQVEAGQELAEIEDPFARAEVKVLEAQRAELVARYDAERREDQMQAEIVKEELHSVEAELARARERVAENVIRSPGAGTFVVAAARDLPGRFVRQGELLGYVTDFAESTARVVVAQTEVGLVRQRTRMVEVKLAERLGRTLPAQLLREVPAASQTLPSPALGSAGGGHFAVDPSDPDGTAALEKLFQFDLRLPEPAYLGGRVFVRFEHGTESLAAQITRRLRQLFLRVFGV